MALTKTAGLVLLAALLAAYPHFATAQDTQLIRVVLSDTGTSVQVGGELSWASPNGELGSTSGVARIELYGSTLEVTIGGRPASASRLIATPATGHVRFAGREYRGWLELFRGREGGLVVLNVLPLEDYLMGVVASEMPPSWPPEALKSQAIAARSYALTRIAAHQDSTYDVYATVADQAYKGIDGEDPRSSEAVKATAGQVVLYDGQVIVAYYCSDAGGYTRAGDLPYLQAVPSRHPDSPHNNWSINLSVAELTEIIAAAGDDIGRLTGAKLLNDPVSGYLASIVVQGEQGDHGFTGEQLRRFVGRGEMKSPRVELQPGAGLAIETKTPEPDEAASAQPDAISISISAGPDWESGLNLTCTPMQAWERPWVAGGARDIDVKLRGLFAYNGSDLLKCNREVFVFAGLESASALLVVPRAVPQYKVPTGAMRETLVTFTSPQAQLTFKGSGYGHGLGMSQWGARELAEEGWNAGQILTYFYTGTTLGSWNGGLPVIAPADSSGFYAPFEFVE